MIKKTLNILLLIFTVAWAHAQQDPLYSQYMFDKLAINPAYAGSNPVIASKLTYRKQFIGLDGAPQTQKLTVSYPIQSKFMGVGLKVMHDKIGATNLTTFTGIYAYHLGLGKGKLSFGLEAGLMNQSTNFGSLIRADPNDLALTSGISSVMIPDASFGMYYHTKKFYLGASVFHLINEKINVTNYKRNPIAQISKHYFITSGYNFKVSKKLEIKPSVLIKSTQAAPLQFDLNTNVIWNEVLSLGVSYRSSGSISTLLRYVIKEKLMIGYSYDIYSSKISPYASGAHEIMLGYQIKLLPPARDKITNPRYYF